MIPADQSDGYIASRTPAADCTVSPRSDEYVARFCDMVTTIKLEFAAYGEPMFYPASSDDPLADIANFKSRRAFRRDDWPGHLAPNPTTCHIPPGFKTSTGLDKHANVWVPGQGWEFWWAYADYRDPDWALMKLGEFFHTGKSMTDSDVMAGTLGKVAIDQEGNTGFYCPGMPRHLTTPSAAQIRSGAIDQMMGLTFPNIMGGPVSPRDPDHLDANHPDNGTRYRFACAPAMGVEGGDQPGDAGQGIANGHRFHLNPQLWTPKRHAAWVATKPLASQHAADAIVTNLILQGFGANQSGPQGVMKASMSLNPLEATQLAALGVTANLLDGVDLTCLELLDPPTATYIGGGTGTREGMCSRFAYT